MRTGGASQFACQPRETSSSKKQKRSRAKDQLNASRDLAKDTGRGEEATILSPFNPPTDGLNALFGMMVDYRQRTGLSKVV